MSKENLYTLANHTVAEPLINKWVAWSHLVPPVAASLHLKHYQIKLLESYLQEPHFHVQACSDPKLRSGPFMNIPLERADEAGELLKKTEQSMSDNIILASELMEFQNHLAARAKGQSLDSFYKRLPASLRGYVELVYDYYNHPIVRFIEPLIYKSRYYKRELQSLRLFKQATDDSRSYILNTPRLAESDQIDWAVAFDGAEVDEFFSLDSTPRPLGYIRELLGLQAKDERTLLPLLTEDRAQPRAAWREPRARLTYFGHACVLVEWNGVSILTDPYIAVVPVEARLDRNSYQDLPHKIDYVIITHNHHDHFCLEALLRLRHRIGCLVVPRSWGIFYGDMSLRLLARKVGFKQVIEMDALDSIELPDGQIIAVPFMGEHADLPHSKTAYVVRAGEDQILFAADSDCLDARMYEHISSAIGRVETVFLGMECVGAPLSWNSGPFLPVRPGRSHEESRRSKGCDSARAMDILQALDAKRVFLYAMGLEPWLEPLLGLAYTEEAPQIIESKALLSKARDMGFLEARLLFGKDEIYLAEPASKRASSAAPRAMQPRGGFAQAHAATLPTPLNSTGAQQVQECDDLSDKFIFE